MLQRVFKGILASPIKRNALFSIAKSLTPNDIRKARSVVQGMSEMPALQWAYRMAINKPQEPDLLQVDHIPIQKYSKKRFQEGHKQAILFLHGGAFSTYLPTFYGYVADYLNVLTALPVRLTKCSLTSILTWLSGVSSQLPSVTRSSFPQGVERLLQSLRVHSLRGLPS